MLTPTPAQLLLSKVSLSPRLASVSGSSLFPSLAEPTPLLLPEVLLLEALLLLEVPPRVLEVKVVRELELELLPTLVPVLLPRVPLPPLPRDLLPPPPLLQRDLVLLLQRALLHVERERPRRPRSFLRK
jgi:hypothetical protein